jgi:hypothetical protein
MRDPFRDGYTVEVKPAKTGDEFWAGVFICFLVLLLIGWLSS